MLINIVKKNSYYDSVFLMLITKKIQSIEGVIDSAVMMATEANKELLLESGLLTDEPSTKNATPNDLLYV